MSPPHQVTEILQAWKRGDEAAADRLIPLVYDELREIAAVYLRGERPGHTLQPTALVHEAYLKLIGQRRVDWQERAHFFGIAARVMRRILLDHARGHLAAKRGGGAVVSLDADPPLDVERPGEIVALDEALHRLAELDPEKARLVELRYFAGLTVAETARALGCSVPTVVRQWRSARAWLYEEIHPQGG